MRDDVKARAVAATRADKLVGRGTCSVIDECYGDTELVKMFEDREITTVRAAVTEARAIHMGVARIGAEGRGRRAQQQSGQPVHGHVDDHAQRLLGWWGLLARPHDLYRCACDARQVSSHVIGRHGRRIRLGIEHRTRSRVGWHDRADAGFAARWKPSERGHHCFRRSVQRRRDRRAELVGVLLVGERHLRRDPRMRQ